MSAFGSFVNKPCVSKLDTMLAQVSWRSTLYIHFPCHRTCRCHHSVWDQHSVTSSPVGWSLALARHLSYSCGKERCHLDSLLPIQFQCVSRYPSTGFPSAFQITPWYTQTIVRLKNLERLYWQMSPWICWIAPTLCRLLVLLMVCDVLSALAVPRRPRRNYGRIVFKAWS